MTSRNIVSPKVFISYSHDSPEHMDRVLGLADHLRAWGIDCELDRYAEAPAEGWPTWSGRQVLVADFVLVACTETYLRRFNGTEEFGKGRGVKWEGMILTQELYEAEGRNRKFIPMVFASDDLPFVPIPLRGATHYVVSSETDFDKLYRRLTDQHLIKKPGLGQLQRLPPRERRTEFLASPWTVPYRHNPLFTGRDAELRQLRETLESKGVAVCTGLGGIGKTQTAVEYAYRYREEYSGALWARMETRETAISDFVAIANLLHLEERDVQEQTAIVAAVRRWLETHSQWLLILDNADDLTIAKEFLPTGKTGHILLTSRSHATGSIGPAVEINRMEQEKAAQFLLRRGRIIGQDALVEHASRADQVTANDITALLDGLPLALDQAGAYLEETGCGLTGYLTRYRDKAIDLLKYRGAAPDHPDPVATTWQLSFEKVKTANLATAELLRLCAFLHPEAIPEELLTKGASEFGSALGLVAANPAEFNMAIAESLKFSLLRRDPVRQTLEMHRLVQEVVRAGMDDATQRQWAERLVRALNIAFPQFEVNTWPQCERLIPHIFAATVLITRWKLDFLQVGGLLHQAGYYLVERARYVEADLLCQQSLAITEKVLGKEHLTVAQILHTLGSLYRTQGRYAEAETLCRQSLAIRKKLLGKEHPDVAQSLNDLALIYDAERRHEEAEPLYQRSLAVLEKVLEKEHPHVAQILHNLAALYRVQGRYAKAEPLCQRSLDIRQKRLGEEHPHVAQSLNNLALIYAGQGRYAKAELLYRRSLAIRKKVLGKEHPDVAMSLHNFALLYQAQGRYVKAEPLYQRSLEIMGKGLGNEHPDVAIVLDNYARLLRQMDRKREANELEERAGRIRTMHLPGKAEK